MTRDRSKDKIFLQNFFKDRLEVFTVNQPEDDTYLFFYGCATDSWIPLKGEIDTYPISKRLREDLMLLFELASEHLHYVGEIEIKHKLKMREFWDKMRKLATKIRAAARYEGLYTE